MKHFVFVSRGLLLAQKCKWFVPLAGDMHLPVTQLITQTVTQPVTQTVTQRAAVRAPGAGPPEPSSVAATLCGVCFAEAHLPLGGPWAEAAGGRRGQPDTLGEASVSLLKNR